MAARPAEKRKPKEFLRDLLANGPILVKDVQKAAREAGLTPKNLRDAREALEIEPNKSSLKGEWVWGLPKPPSVETDPGVDTDKEKYDAEMDDLWNGRGEKS